VNVLLDTHTLLWWLDDNPRLGGPSRAVIRDRQNVVVVSAATAWEIAIKRARGRLDAPDDLPGAIAAHGFTPLSITVEHGLDAGALPPYHRDPFDRMLVAQARIEGLTIVTADPRIARYDVPTLAA
jgi:PIN domain nuclease of toxin-antitoxin system